MVSRRTVLRGLALSALATNIAPARAAEPLRMRVGWVLVPTDLLPILPAAPQLTRHMGKSYVLELQHFAGTTPMITALASGAIDIAALAFGSLPFAVENAKLEDLRIIADMFQDGAPGYHTNPYLVLKDSPIRRVEELRGKVLASNVQGSAADIALRAMLRKHGIDDRADVQIIEAPFPTMKAVLKERKAVLIPGVLPFTADPELAAISRPLFTQAEAMKTTQQLVRVSRTGFLARHRAAMVDLLEDILRVQHFYSDPAHHEEAVQMVAKLTKQPAANLESWLFTKADYYRSPEGLPNLAALQANIETMREVGIISRSIDTAKYADLDLIKTAAKRIESKS